MEYSVYLSASNSKFVIRRKIKITRRNNELLVPGGNDNYPQLRTTICTTNEWTSFFSSHDFSISSKATVRLCRLPSTGSISRTILPWIAVRTVQLLKKSRVISTNSGKSLECVSVKRARNEQNIIWQAMIPKGNDKKKRNERDKKRRLREADRKSQTEPARGEKEKSREEGRPWVPP